jgi:hypothetical protein
MFGQSDTKKEKCDAKRNFVLNCGFVMIDDARPLRSKQFFHSSSSCATDLKAKKGFDWEEALSLMISSSLVESYFYISLKISEFAVEIWSVRRPFSVHLKHKSNEVFFLSLLLLLVLFFVVGCG